MPKSPYHKEGDQVATLMDNTGGLVSLPSDLRVCRYLTAAKLNQPSVASLLFSLFLCPPFHFHSPFRSPFHSPLHSPFHFPFFIAFHRSHWPSMLPCTTSLTSEGILCVYIAYCVVWCHVVSCGVMWCHAVSYGVMWCHVVSCSVM